MVSPSKLRFRKELDDLELNDLQFLIDNKIDESQNLEYKEPSETLKDDCNRIGETISGFLNTDGGIIICGISEAKDNHHGYPNKIVWSQAIKETMESILISKIHPWDERIKIHRIVNLENSQEGIFILEVPKSSNPPHMYNNVYYQRLNYQTKPMEHKSVYRAFQTSWTRRRDIVTQIIEPLYSEIKSNYETIRDYGGGITGSIKFSAVIENNRYLFDQLEPVTKGKITEFYDRLNKHISPNRESRGADRAIIYNYNYNYIL